MADSGPEPPGHAETPAGAVVPADDGEPAVLRVSGALDLAPELQRLVDQATRTGPRLPVVDLSAVDFLASAGMAVLVRAHRHAAPSAVRAAASGRLTLRPPEMTRLTDELAVFPALAAALAGR
jgi:anti-anti-sigma factor